MTRALFLADQRNVASLTVVTLPGPTPGM